MNKLRLALSALFLMALSAVWVYLFLNTRAIDSAKQNQILAQITQIKQVDSEWNVDVLKSQIEMNKNYDPLVKPLGQISAVMDQLKPEAHASDSEEVRVAAMALGEAIARKSAIVDRFKTHNAIIKNSLRYIPTAYAEAQELLRTERGPGMPPPAKAASFESALGGLVSEILKYNTVPDAETSALVAATVPVLLETAQAYPVPIRETVENLLTHAETILRQRTRQGELLAQVAQVPMAERLDALSLAFSNRFDRELEGQAKYQQLLLFYSGIALLAIALAIAFLIYRSRTEFKRMAIVVEQTKAALRQSEAQLIHAEKMSMMGEIVGGIVHEINTPLGYLRSGLESAKDNLNSVMLPYTTTTGQLLAMLRSPGHDRAELQRIYNQLHTMQEELRELDLLKETASLLSDGIDGVGHINETVVNLLNFSRLDRTRVALNKVENGLDSTLKLANHILKRKKVVRNYGDTSEIYCDLSQLNQVFLNIIKNAAQATPLEGGEITIQTMMPDNTSVRIEITDNGAGIPPETLPKIFDAFFTTKKAGSGTGLGLSISKRIIESHGGQIKVRSIPGVGTTFSIIVPVIPPTSLSEEKNEKGEEFEIA